MDTQLIKSADRWERAQVFKTTSEDTLEGVMKKPTRSYYVIMVDFLKFSVTPQQFVFPWFLQGPYTCSEMHLSLLLTPSSLSKKNPTTAPLVSLYFPPKTECRCFYTDTESGGGTSKVSPLCNSMHYMLSLPSNTSRGDSHFPGLLLCSLAPRLVTTQAETDPVNSRLQCMFKLHISVSTAKHSSLETGIFHMGVSLQI